MIVPMAEFESIMEEPSSGSKVQMNLPSGLRIFVIGLSSEHAMYTTPLSLNASKIMESIWISKSSCTSPKSLALSTLFEVLYLI